MNYNGWSNEETYQTSLILQNSYYLYEKAMRFKEASIDSEVLAYKLKDLVKEMLREDEKISKNIGDIDKVDFKEIAQAFYDE